MVALLLELNSIVMILKVLLISQEIELQLNARGLILTIAKALSAKEQGPF